IYFWLTYEPSSPNLAAAAGTLLLLVTLTGIFVYRRMTRIASRFVTVTGKPKPAARIPLGRWRIPVIALLAGYFFVTTVRPLAASVFGSFLPSMGRRVSLAMLTLRNYDAAFRGENLTAMGNSLFLAVATATLTTLLGFLVSYCVQRTTARGRGLLDYISAL